MIRAVTAAVVRRGAVVAKSGLVSPHHVGIVREDAAPSNEGTLPVWDAESGGLDERAAAFDLVADDELGEDDVERLHAWVTTLLASGVKTEYACIPEYSIEDRNGTDVHRMSCAGFVAEAYRRIGRQLVETRELPVLGRKELVSIWPLLAWLPTKQQERIGLLQSDERRDGGFRVLIPAYLLHALDLPPSARPLHPTGDHVGFELTGE